jgi:retinoid hydroxylase
MCAHEGPFGYCEKLEPSGERALFRVKFSIIQCLHKVVVSVDHISLFIFLAGDIMNIPRCISDQPLPPGTFGLPLIGETLQFLLDPQFAERRHRRHGPIVRTHILGSPTVIVKGPEANRMVLSSNIGKFSWGEGWPGTFKELFGDALFVQDGPQHEQNRKLLMPAFHSRALFNYWSTMNHITEQYLQKWEHWSIFQWLSEFKLLTFDIASALLLGIDAGTHSSVLLHWFEELTNGLFALPLRWRWTRYGRALHARDQLLAHIEREVRRRQQQPATDALGLLVQSRDEQGRCMPLNEIYDQVLLLLFAGHETTASMLTSLCLALSQNPDVLARARQEQCQLASEGPWAIDQCSRMPYLEQVLREVERLYPPALGGFRRVMESFVFNGYHVPQGWKLLYHMPATHHDRGVFTNPDRFDPDRFSQERAEHKRQAFSLVGFGGGPRICIGMAFAQLEMKLIAAQLLRRYKWEVLPHQDLSFALFPTRHPRDGLRIRFQRI